MTGQAEEVLQQLLNLPEPDRSDVVARCLQVLQTDAGGEDEAAWGAEIERRAQDFVTGKEPGIPGEEVFAEIRKMLNLP